MCCRNTGRFPRRIIHHDDLTVCDRLHKMWSVRWYDPDKTGTDPLSNAADSELQFAFDHFVHFFLRMAMLMDRGSCVEFIMREGHVGRIEVAASPARQPFDCRQFAGIDEWHTPPPRGR